MISDVTGTLENGTSNICYETAGGEAEQGAIDTSQAVQDPVQCFIRDSAAGEPVRALPGI